MTDIPNSLPDLVQALRSGALSLTDYLRQLEARIAASEASIEALVPEPGRFDRLRQEAEALRARYPDAEDRPPLFGVPVGVKDILHVDGFVTRAGSKLPAEELQGAESAAVTVLKQV